MGNYVDSLHNPQQAGPYSISLRCPSCQQIGIFMPLGINDIISVETTRQYGQRKCPNSACDSHIFVVIDREKNEIIKSYPGVTIPFDSSRIPERIIKAFTEALKCHSQQCYIASAIMIRKTLEEIAEEKGVTGENLFKRINAVGKIIVLPKELLEAMQELRLLGNDAAHIESKTFEEIGKDEVEISIEFTKEILKATYQYEDLLGKLRSLKKQ